MTDTECRNVTVTRIRKKIDRKCITKVRIQKAMIKILTLFLSPD